MMKPVLPHFLPWWERDLTAIRTERERRFEVALTQPVKRSTTKKKTTAKRKKVDLSKDAREALEGLDPAAAAFLKQTLGL